jgi:hypothetical protein
VRVHAPVYRPIHGIIDLRHDRPMFDDQHERRKTVIESAHATLAPEHPANTYAA